MSCEFDKKLLDAYADEELSPEEAKAVEEHVLECADCRTEMEALKALSADIRGVYARTAPASAVEKVRSSVAAAEAKRRGMYFAYHAAAAAAVVVLVAAVTIKSYRSGEKDEFARIARMKAPALKEEVPNEAGAANATLLVDKVGIDRERSVPSPAEDLWDAAPGKRERAAKPTAAPTSPATSPAPATMPGWLAEVAKASPEKPEMYTGTGKALAGAAPSAGAAPPAPVTAQASRERRRLAAEPLAGQDVLTEGAMARKLTERGRPLEDTAAAEAKAGGAADRMKAVREEEDKSAAEKPVASRRVILAAKDDKEALDVLAERAKLLNAKVISIEFAFLQEAAEALLRGAADAARAEDREQQPRRQVLIALLHAPAALDADETRDKQQMAVDGAAHRPEDEAAGEYVEIRIIMEAAAEARH